MSDSGFDLMTALLVALAFGLVAIALLNTNLLPGFGKFIVTAINEAIRYTSGGPVAA
ncbi:MAG: hypothetical protein HYW26_03160 [Candidatus Aenigmarchaeota archaeon]|nr:hypothetical protein [Candidatus Aenigmarchaeota archaeon]